MGTSETSIGIALGGGAARGFAHVVVLEALDDLGVRPSVIAGTSMGALIGAAYAAGLPARDIREHLAQLFSGRTALLRRLQERWPGSLFSLWNPLTPALVNGETLFGIVLPDALPASFEELKVPFRVVATDYYEQDQVILTSGPLIPAITASSALPGLITPVEIGGRVLIDGGCVNPTPFDIVQKEAAITVAVDVLAATAHREDRRRLPSSIEAWISSLQILFRAIMREKERVSPPDILIRPPIGAFNALDFYRCSEILVAAAPAKEELKRKLGARLERVP